MWVGYTKNLRRLNPLSNREGIGAYIDQLCLAKGEPPVRFSRLLLPMVLLLSAAFLLMSCDEDKEDKDDDSGGDGAEARAIQVAEEGVDRNADWQPYLNIENVTVRDFGDGVAMVLVPAGCFEMGSTNEQINYAVNELDGQREWYEDEQPVSEQCFDAPFWIDRYEVTNGQFNRLGGEAAAASRWTGSERPREQITWLEAQAFCAKRDARLPTEREWEYAARGPDGLVYPWGNTFVAANVVYDGNSGSQTANVGSRPGGVSWVGAYDMSGNVWEWTASIYDQERFPYPYNKDDGRENTNNSTDVSFVLRGGSWSDFDSLVRAALRGGSFADFRGDDYGFRCARS